MTFVTRVVCAHDLVRTPWKNGGGTTAEVAAFPPGAGFEDFGWRISMADVAADGPFSAFGGIDRTLVLIEGAALELDIDGVVHRLDEATPLRSFRGEAATFGRLPAGPIRDLNVMTRRGRFGHAVDVVPPGVVDLHAEPAAALAVVALQDATRLGLDAEVHDLGRFDVLLTDGVPSRLSTDRQVLRVVLRPVAPG
ncbi:MAG TPA: HutD family protein [Lichenihabitans sp.]|jgi:hypothetical protein|nr:HutD family protein [Lichenihabitans sp.]